MIVALLCFVTSTPVVAILDFVNMAPIKNRKSMVWATYVPNLVLLEESESKIPNSPDYFSSYECSRCVGLQADAAAMLKQ